MGAKSLRGLAVVAGIAAALAAAPPGRAQDGDAARLKVEKMKWTGGGKPGAGSVVYHLSNGGSVGATLEPTGFKRVYIEVPGVIPHTSFFGPGEIQARKYQVTVDDLLRVRDDGDLSVEMRGDGGILFRESRRVTVFIFPQKDLTVRATQTGAPLKGSVTVAKNGQRTLCEEPDCVNTLIKSFREGKDLFDKVELKTAAR